MSGIKFLGALSALLASTSAFAQTGEWRLSEASGRVVVRDAGGEHPVARGSVVPAGATLMTGPGARAVAVRGEDFVTVAANSRMRVPAAAQATGMIQMLQEWGSAVFRIKHLPKPHFAVQTPYLAAVVKGTTFSVTVTGEGASVQVIDGAVEVATTDGGAHELVRPGVVATVAAGDRYRLNVQGQESRAIDSPARGTQTSAVGPEPQPEAAATAPTPAPAGDDDVTWTDVSSAVVATPITAKPVDLGALTGGMVSGRAGVEVAALVTPAVARTAAEASATMPGVTPASAAPRPAPDTSAAPATPPTDAHAAGTGSTPAVDTPAAPDMGIGKEAKDPVPNADKDAKTDGKDADKAAKDDAKDAKDDAKLDPKDPKAGKDDAKPDPKDDKAGKDDAKPDPKDDKAGKDDAKPDPKDDKAGKDDAKPDPKDDKAGKDDAKPDPNDDKAKADKEAQKAAEDAAKDKPDNTGPGNDDAGSSGKGPKGKKGLKGVVDDVVKVIL